MTSPTNEKDEPCKHCNGTGRAVPDCEVCEGNGWVDDPDDGGTMTCPECNDDKCDFCGGEGYEPEEN